MTKFSIPKNAEKMSSEDLVSLSANMTGAKDEMLLEYKSVQEKLHELIAKKQKEEQEERINNDPDYWKKHQGVK